MNIIHDLKRAFGLLADPTPPSLARYADEAQREDVKQRIVVRLSRGNVRLKRGQYTTEQDIEASRKRILTKGSKGHKRNRKSHS